MGRPRKPPSVEAAKTSNGSDDKVTLGDTAGMKHALDAAAIEVVLSRGYKEDHFVSNVKLTLGLASILLALVAQFYPGKLPQNWWLVFFCVAGYGVLTTALSIFCSNKEGDSILFTKPRKDVSMSSQGTGLALKVSTTLPRFSDKFTLKIEAIDEKDPSRRPVELKESVAAYFHEDGFLAKGKFQGDVSKSLHSFENKD